MFQNCGGKLKTFALVVFIISIVALIIASLFVLINIKSLGWEFLFLILPASFLASWIFSLCLYGFGEIVEKVSAISDNPKNKTANEDVKNVDTTIVEKNVTTPTSTPSTSEKARHQDLKVCRKCGKLTYSNYCTHCSKTY